MSEPIPANLPDPTSGRPTDEQVSAAIKQCNGSYGAASRLLGYGVSYVSNRVSASPLLKARWENKVTVTGRAAARLNRKAIPVDEGEPTESPLKLEEEVAAALKREDSAIRNGMEGMGLAKTEVDLSVALQQFQKRHFRSTIDGISGGVYRQFMKVLLAIDKIEDRLNSIEPLPVPVEMMLREDRVKLLNIVGQYKREVDKSVLIQAQVHKILGDKKKSREQPSRGFLDLKEASGPPTRA